MAVHIRLTRVGRKNLAKWRIAVFDSRTRRDGRVIENLGTYDPHEEKGDRKVRLNVERYRHWLSVGALPTGPLQRLLSHAGSLTPQ